MEKKEEEKLLLHQNSLGGLSPDPPTTDRHGPLNEALSELSLRTHENTAAATETQNHDAHEVSDGEAIS